MGFPFGVVSDSASANFAKADMAHFDLTDFKWSVIEPLLPTKVYGVKRMDDQRALSGIFWWLRTGTP
jgi:hypothetical protein